MAVKFQNPKVVGASIAGGLLLVSGGLWLFKPWLLFVDKTVNQPLPITSASVQMVDSSEMASTLSNDGAASLVADGDFISHEHETTGKASIVQLANGKYQLAFENLDTSNGPDVHVWVSAGEVVDGVAGLKAAGDHDKIDLGVIKGNKGNQLYDLPDDFDPTKWKSIDLWCDQFDVSFGAAPLNLKADSSSSTDTTSTSETMVMAEQSGPVIVTSGDFIKHEHATTGKASVVRLENGKHQLIFENLDTSNGPDVHVWVSAGEVVDGIAGLKAAGDHDKIDLGVIKGNKGNQVYDLPDDFDPTKWKSVDLWCDQFDVSFGAAPLV
ncbi:DM13 domain-containing protein [Stomatohabitans albus]|uniref:DM13 domain-containing protein n=1 Tax=Stomatohabitans albus TaxID=3110766 RepID=UPI00300C344A